MSFPSRYATEIWDALYTVDIPDKVTHNRDYLRKFGTYSTGYADMDKTLQNSFTTVRIPIIKILEYFLSGVEIRIKSRQDLNSIYKSINNYLQEWKDYIKYNINTDEREYKELLVSLDKLSKYIYDKLGSMELIEKLFVKRPLGIKNPLEEIQEKNNYVEPKKPNYEGISSIIKSRAPKDTQSEIKGTGTRF
jgi:hypothetical protein